ncbi:hypothetical protein F441_12261 [Phytophthora nicotianae CJ01A1]|uniref:RxLR effector protein n=4 Tax=Phytophthora nicotianae TaxID=4792 RepID=V9EUQ1_PHYNI|nr:hypothetical protein F443_12276 [Phytophthora nicotianae P1569]ETP12310.1 hypothetical protein F441_12261 [Phytophthora nicotianae CJ01A1]
MRFFIFLALVVVSTINGITNADQNLPVISTTETVDFDSMNNDVRRLRKRQKLDDEERDAAAYLLDSDDESTTSKKRKDGKASQFIHQMDEKPLSPKAKMWMSALTLLFGIGITAGAAFGITKLMN